jgi:hypothetical protein
MCRLQGADADVPAIFFSSGDRVHSINATSTFTHYAENPGAQFRAYSGVADQATYRSAFGRGSHLALFHYVTKDAENLIAKRAQRPIKWDVPLGMEHMTFRDAPLLAAFEARQHYDGQHAVCSAALQHDYAGQSARAWQAYLSARSGARQ